MQVHQQKSHHAFKRWLLGIMDGSSNFAVLAELGFCSKYLVGARLLMLTYCKCLHALFLVEAVFFLKCSLLTGITAVNVLAKKNAVLACL